MGRKLISLLVFFLVGATLGAWLAYNPLPFLPAYFNTVVAVFTGWTVGIFSPKLFGRKNRFLILGMFFAGIVVSICLMFAWENYPADPLDPFGFKRSEKKFFSHWFNARLMEKIEHDRDMACWEVNYVVDKEFWFSPKLDKKSREPDTDATRTPEFISIMKKIEDKPHAFRWDASPGLKALSCEEQKMYFKHHSFFSRLVEEKTEDKNNTYLFRPAPRAMEELFPKKGKNP